MSGNVNTPFQCTVLANLVEQIILITSFTSLYSGDQKYVVTRKMDSIVPMNKEEAIFLAKFPDGSKPEGYRRAPIEREDWPAPPEPAAAYPELCKLAVEIDFQKALSYLNQNSTLIGPNLPQFR